MDKTCAWCHKRTDLPKVFAADGPLLEWFEKIIDKYCIENLYKHESLSITSDSLEAICTIVFNR